MSIGPVEVLFLLVLFVIPIYVGYRMGRTRGQTALGVVLGLVLGWLGLLILLFVKKPPTAA